MNHKSDSVFVRKQELRRKVSRSLAGIVSIVSINQIDKFSFILNKFTIHEILFIEYVHSVLLANLIDLKINKMYLCKQNIGQRYKFYMMLYMRHLMVKFNTFNQRNILKIRHSQNC